MSSVPPKLLQISSLSPCDSRDTGIWLLEGEIDLPLVKLSLRTLPLRYNTLLDVAVEKKN